MKKQQFLQRIEPAKNQSRRSSLVWGAKGCQFTFLILQIWQRVYIKPLSSTNHFSDNQTVQMKTSRRQGNVNKASEF